MRIRHWISRTKYLHGKAVYEYERFCIPVPKRFQHIVKPFISRDVEIKIEPCKDGFTVKVHLSSSPK